jgi:Ca-activated chloride channel family protein
VKLAKRFGIVTPYTSYLIVEDETRRRGPPTGAASGPLTPGFGLAPGGGDPNGGPSTGGSGGGGGAPAPPAEAGAREALADSAAKAGRSKDKESGADAVDLSRENRDLSKFEGEKDAKGTDALTKRIVRHLAGRTFVAKGGVWWDAAVDLRKERRAVEAFSDAYFELLRAHPEIGPYLTLGDVVLAVGDEVVEVRQPR